LFPYQINANTISGPYYAIFLNYQNPLYICRWSRWKYQSFKCDYGILSCFKLTEFFTDLSESELVLNIAKQVYYRPLATSLCSFNYSGRRSQWQDRYGHQIQSAEDSFSAWV